MTRAARTLGAAAPPLHAQRSPRSGMLVVDKPTDMTSHDVVRRVRGRYHVAGGHLGTLDPGASGLLLVALGAATRCANVWQGGEKTYEATVRFGVVTSTQDLEGDVLETRPVLLDEASIRAASRSMVGEIDQVPPMVSALKVRGERLYKMARRGEVVERAARRVRIAEWTWLGFDLPDARFRVRCSGGTYVRTLAHDLGAALGSGAALAALRRLRSEPFGLERAVRLADLEEGDAETVWAESSYSMEEILAALPSVRLSERDVLTIGYGGSVRVPCAEARAVPLGAGPRSVALVDGAGTALGLGEALACPAGPGFVTVCPHLVFPWAVREGRL